MTATLLTAIDPPIIVRTSANNALALATINQLQEYVRQHNDVGGWDRLRDAAFVAAALPTTENIEALRKLAGEAFP